MTVTQGPGPSMGECGSSSAAGRLGSPPAAPACGGLAGERSCVKNLLAARLHGLLILTWRSRTPWTGLTCWRRDCGVCVGRGRYSDTRRRTEKRAAVSSSGCSVSWPPVGSGIVTSWSYWPPVVERGSIAPQLLLCCPLRPNWRLPDWRILVAAGLLRAQFGRTFTPTGLFRPGLKAIREFLGGREFACSPGGR